MLMIVISWSLVKEKQALLVCVLHFSLHVDLNVECGIYISHKKSEKSFLELFFEIYTLNVH